MRVVDTNQYGINYFNNETMNEIANHAISNGYDLDIVVREDLNSYIEDHFPDAQLSERNFSQLYNLFTTLTE